MLTTIHNARTQTGFLHPFQKLKTHIDKGYHTDKVRLGNVRKRFARITFALDTAYTRVGANTLLTDEWKHAMREEAKAIYKEGNQRKLNTFVSKTHEMFMRAAEDLDSKIERNLSVPTRELIVK